MGGKLSKQELTISLTANAHNNNKTTNISFLTKADQDTAREVFADGFQHDPLFHWIAELNDDDPNKEEKVKELCRYVGGVINDKLISGGRGAALGVRDEHDSKSLIGFMAVAPSSCVKDRMIDDIISVIKYGAPPLDRASGCYGVHSTKRLELVLDELKKAKTRLLKGTDRWIYLQAISVTSANQHGKGYGSTMLRYLNQVADSLGVAIYLETESPENESMYKHFGYSTLEELKLCVEGDESSDASFTMYLMRRDPITSSDNEQK